MRTMNCSEAERLFDPYLDGELSGSLRLEFDAHRLRCAMCQRKLAMMEACEQIVAGDRRAPLLSQNFTDRVMSDLIRRKAEASRSHRRRWTAPAALALQAAAVIGFVFLWQPVRSALFPTVNVERGISIHAIKLREPGPGIGDWLARGAQGVWGAKSELAEGVNALPRYAVSFALSTEFGSSEWSEPLSWLLGVGGVADPQNSAERTTSEDGETFTL